MERVRQLARRLLGLSRVFDLRDVFVFGGLASLVYGVSQVSGPAAWSVGGLVLLALGVRR